MNPQEPERLDERYVEFDPTAPTGLLAPSALKPWGVLEQLPPLLPTAPAMSEWLLPESLRPWIIDIAERLQAPMETIAVPAMVGVAGVVGRSCGILPKRHDDWLVVPNLWGGIVARPGFMKTASLTEAFKPIHVLVGDGSRGADHHANNSIHRHIGRHRRTRSAGSVR